MLCLEFRVKKTDILKVSHEYRVCQNLCLFASTTGSSISISITYIVFVTKLQKRQIPLEEFALTEQRYPKYFRSLILMES